MRSMPCSIADSGQTLMDLVSDLLAALVIQEVSDLGLL